MIQGLIVTAKCYIGDEIAEKSLFFGEIIAVANAKNFFKKNDFLLQAQSLTTTHTVATT